MTVQLSIKLEKMTDKGESTGLFFQSHEVRLGEGEGIEVAREIIFRNLETYLERLTKVKI